MKAEAVYELLRLLWPTFATKHPREDFVAAWGPEIAAVTDAAGTAALRAHARVGRFPPSLAEFLSATGRQGQHAPGLPRPQQIACCGKADGCAVVCEGTLQLHAHEDACPKAQAVLKAGVERGVQVMAELRKRLGAPRATQDARDAEDRAYQRSRADEVERQQRAVDRLTPKAEG